MVVTYLYLTPPSQDSKEPAVSCAHNMWELTVRILISETAFIVKADNSKKTNILGNKGPQCPMYKLVPYGKQITVLIQWLGTMTSICGLQLPQIYLVMDCMPVSVLEEWLRYPCGDPSGTGQMHNCMVAGLYQECNWHVGGIVYVQAVWWNGLQCSCKY